MLKLIKNLLGHKKAALTVSIIYTSLLLLVSLLKLEGLPEEAVKNNDKLFHFSAYLVLTLLWFNTLAKIFEWGFLKIIFIGFISCIAFGIIVEGLQRELTSFRTADIYDVLANSLGVLAAVILVKVTGKVEVKKL